MIKSVSNDAIKITSVNGIPAIYAIGDYVTIEAADGFLYQGTILPENPAAHVNKKLYEMVPSYDDSFVRLDHRFSEEDKIKDHIQIGDYVFLDPKFKYIDGFIKTRFLDDKASCSIFLHLAEILKDMEKEGKISFRKPVYMYFNVTEETGQGIANLPDIDELYIVDMGVVGTGVEGNEYSVSICPKDSSGPYNFELTKKLEALARKNDIKYVKDIFPYYGSDGSAALRAGLDIKVALFGVGVSASHGYERTHEMGLLNTAKLMSSIIEEVIH
jgi:putative aminopeptidase FrvX